MAWPRKPGYGEQCERRLPGRDFMGPTVSRCAEPATETVVDTKTNPIYLCDDHVQELWHQGLVKRNPRFFPVDPNDDDTVQ